MNKKQKQKINGWIALDKPLGLTSTQALGKVRRLLNAEKAGHAGTLDPLATGVLPIALGEATKTISFVQDAEKIYSFTIRWGEARTTDDCEGEVMQTSDKRPTREEIEKLIPNFVGTLTQTPPKFSAIKIDGERAYDLARNNEEFEIKSRQVESYALTLTDMPDADQACFTLHCGKGFYVRALARDLGEALGCYGHIMALRREKSGGFTLKNAILLDELAKIEHVPPLENLILPVQTALDDIPALAINELEAHRLRCGQAISFLSRSDVARLQALGFANGPADSNPQTIQIAVAATDEKPVAIVRIEGATVRPVRVLNL